MNWSIDKVMLVLCGFTVFFTGVLIGIVYTRPDDGQTYQTFAGLLTGFGGALLMRLTPEKAVPPPGSVTTSTESTTQKITTPPVEPPAAGKEPT